MAQFYSGVDTIDEYERVRRIVEAFVEHMKPVSITVKVLCLTLKEAQAMGFVPSGLFQNQTPQEEAEMRQLAVSTLKEVLVGQDVGGWGSGVHGVKARTEALRLLQELGELK